MQRTFQHVPVPPPTTGARGASNPPLAPRRLTPLPIVRDTAQARERVRPRWLRPAFAVLLVGTALLYLWGLGASGTANQFYAAAAQAGSISWKAMLFGSLDPGNAITVDKPPASLWVMALSVRLFGLSGWSLLVPQALMGVGSVAILVAAVRRVSGAAVGLAAGALLALTPVAALMFRFDNPDALLVLLMTGAGYAMVRALERGHSRWIVLAGVLLGFGFLTKMLQAFLVLPGFALVYLIAGPVRLRRRVWQLGAGLAAIVLSAGWWVALVALWPAASRPYIGGSEHNSVLELAFGYNGLSRLSSGGAGGGSFSGVAGFGRLFNAEMGGEISWLLPAALVALAGGLVLARHAPRTDRRRASLALWGSWLLVSGAVFSFMTGIVHTYYTVALAPALAAVLAIGGQELWHARRFVEVRILAALGLLATAVWDTILLGRDASWHPWLRAVVAVAGVSAAILVLLSRPGAWRRTGNVCVASITALALLAAPGAWSLATAATTHTGSTPSSGPVSGGGGGGIPGGAQTTSASLVALLESDNGAHRWAAATEGSMSAAPLQLASDTSVMAIGGFTGSDPSPTLAQFEHDVQAGDIHWYVAGGQGGGPGGQGTSSIATWVAAHYTAQTVGGTTVYDLTHPTAG